MEENLDAFLKEIDSAEKEFTTYVKWLLSVTGNELYPMDRYTIGMVNRSLSLTYGFNTLLRSDNFMAAAHLVRPYLDTYLRYYAAWLVADPNEFALDVIKGGVIKKMKDKNGAKMSDLHLKNEASKDHEWMSSVYETSSGFIHFSSKHILTSLRVLNAKDGTIAGKVGKYDLFVPNESKVEAAKCMLEITNSLFGLMTEWYEARKNPTVKEDQ